MYANAIKVSYRLLQTAFFIRHMNRELGGNSLTPGFDTLIKLIIIGPNVDLVITNYYI